MNEVPNYVTFFCGAHLFESLVIIKVLSPTGFEAP